MSSVNLYSSKSGEIYRFLNNFFEGKQIDIPNDLKWEKIYYNPIELVDIIGTFIDNNDKYDINMWICLDPGLFINITENNADKIIRYIYERYP